MSRNFYPEVTPSPLSNAKLGVLPTSPYRVTKKCSGQTDTVSHAPFIVLDLNNNTVRCAGMFCLFLWGCLGISEMDNKPLLTKKRINNLKFFLFLIEYALHFIKIIHPSSVILCLHMWGDLNCCFLLSLGHEQLYRRNECLLHISQLSSRFLT